MHLHRTTIYQVRLSESYIWLDSLRIDVTLNEEFRLYCSSMINISYPRYTAQKQ